MTRKNTVVPNPLPVMQDEVRPATVQGEPVLTSMTKEEIVAKCEELAEAPNFAVHPYLVSDAFGIVAITQSHFDTEAMRPIITITGRLDMLSSGENQAVTHAIEVNCHEMSLAQSAVLITILEALNTLVQSILVAISDEEL